MPRHIVRPTEGGANRAELLADLMNELSKPKAIGRPIVLEDHTPETDSVRVQVIWDRWDECPRDARSGIILEAYENTYGKEFRRQITLALGVTVAEAAGMGLLPFKVMPARRRDGQPSREESKRAMFESGASTIPGEAGPQIRCATLEDAEATIEYLEDKVPDSKWIIAQEMAAFSD
jgi:hypothetical protein